MLLFCCRWYTGRNFKIYFIAAEVAKAILCRSFIAADTPVAILKII
jgi:hypothetical protein